MPLCKCFSAFCVLAAVLSAADPFVGTWKLNVDKSVLGEAVTVKTGSASYEALGNGYVYDAEIVFENSKVARLHSAIQFDETEHEARLDGRAVKVVSNRIDTNSYRVVITDAQTGRPTNTLRYVVRGDTLIFSWLDAYDQPSLVLVYDREQY